MVVPSKKKPAVLNIFRVKCRVVPKLATRWYQGLQILKMHFTSLNLSWGAIEVQSSQYFTFTSLNFSYRVMQVQRGLSQPCVPVP
jgi:hypothetical protein